MTRKFNIFMLLVLLSSLNFAAENKKECEIKKVKNDIQIDGVLDEEAWQKASWQRDFQMYYPYDNKQATQQTKFAVLYDENYVYVAVKAFDNQPEEIMRRVTRRDDIDGDYIGIQFDSYNDKQTAYCFKVSAAGSKQDIFISGDGDSEDDSYDPIWWVETNVQNDGWVAEMKIPFSQFRFVNTYEQTWGVQVERFIKRYEEISLWQPIKRDDSGWVHHYAQMHGLVDIQPKKVMDLYPYAVGGVSSYEKEEGNPYRTGTDAISNIGIDGKVGLTNNLTLDFTINPDFGQVEADPSNVNLTGFELFFPEKRPFFIEGNNILSFPLMFGDGDLAYDNPYYSRRIGRQPYYNPEYDYDTAYAQVPNNTTILGAAKITGRTDKGLSIGVLETVTQEEKAKYQFNDGAEKEMIAEPLTNYSMVSLRQDFNDGNTLLGGILTSVNRQIDAEHLNNLHRNAYTGGLDFTKYWKEKTWFFSAKGIFSHVNGDKTAIAQTQESLIHNYTRPDADYLDYDTTATQLSGYGGNIYFGKTGGKIRFVSALYFKSPGLELNDFGFVQHADDIITINWMGYRINEPFSIFRNMNFNFNHWSNFDFGGNYLGNGGNVNMNGTFKNYYSFGFGVNVNANQVSNTQLRGGPAYHIPGNTNQWIWLSSDTRKKFYVNMNVSFSQGFQHYLRSQYYSVSFNYQPINILELSINPTYYPKVNHQQYVTSVDYNNSTHYILGTLDRETISAGIRANLNVTPDLSFQLWMQPYFANGKFSDFKEVTDSYNKNYENRFETITEGQIAYLESDNVYVVDKKTDGDPDYYIDNLDFNSKFSQLNFVTRWEYRPGSVLFFVWSKNKGNFDGTPNQGFSNDFADLWNQTAEHTFLVKLSYRIGI